jgi:hypothetical protein
MSAGFRLKERGHHDKLFHTKTIVRDRVCALMIDHWSSINVASIEMVDKLGLLKMPHPQTYYQVGVQMSSPSHTRPRYNLLWVNFLERFAATLFQCTWSHVICFWGNHGTMNKEQFPSSITQISTINMLDVVGWNILCCPWMCHCSQLGEMRGYKYSENFHEFLRCSAEIYFRTATSPNLTFLKLELHLGTKTK